MRPTRFSRNAFALSASAAVLVYLFARAWFVPVSHDEAVTYLLYVQSGDFLPHNMIWDANNHLLNSALIYPLSRVFDPDIFVFRLPNVLSFIIYSWAVHRLLMPLKNHFVYSMGFVALVSPALLLEFFAQARGYGMSMAFLAAALLALSRWWKQPHLRVQWALWAMLWLAMLSNMSLLNTYLLVLAAVAAGIFLHRERIAARGNILSWLLGGLLPAVGFSLYALAMREGGLLYYGEQSGFIEITVRTLSRYVLYTESSAALFALCAIGLAAGIYALFPLLRGKVRDLEFGTFAAYLLLGNAAGAIVLDILLDVNYPEDRTGIYFIPLFILVLIYALDRLQSHWPYGKYPAAGLSVIPLALIGHANFGYVHLWQDLHTHEGLYEQVLADAKGSDPPVMVEGYLLKSTSWGFHTLRHEEKLPPLTAIRNSNLLSDYAICHDSACAKYISEYDTLWKDPRNRTYLMKRQVPMNLEQYHRSEGVTRESGDEFVNFLEYRNAAPLPREGVLEVAFTLQSEADPLQLDIVLSARNADDQVIYADVTGVNWIRPHWQGERLHFRRPFSLPEGAHSMICYFWNPKKTHYEVTVEPVQLLQAAPTNSAERGF